jgi:mRNA interferase RelE/StbE
MALTVEWTENAIRDLSGLPADRRAQIIRRVEAWAGGMPSDVKKLAGSDEFRLRIGDYRLIFTREGQHVTIERVFHRKDAY